MLLIFLKDSPEKSNVRVINSGLNFTFCSIDSSLNLCWQPLQLNTCLLADVPYLTTCIELHLLHEILFYGFGLSCCKYTLVAIQNFVA
jgi:hypothetical protein